jgi:hypothetical protein
MIMLFFDKIPLSLVLVALLVTFFLATGQLP